MLAFYNIGVKLYYLGVLVASFFNRKAKLWLTGRHGLLEKIEQEVAAFSGKTIWVHCSSLGEFEMARPIMEGIKNSDPNCRLVLTFFSPSGYEVRKDYSMANHVFYLPLDTRTNAVRFVKAIKPSTTIFVKYDLWFHYLNEAKKAGSNLLLISAQFRKSQAYFKFYGDVGRNALKLFDQIFLVDEESKILLQNIGVENSTVCGDTRYDRVMEIAANLKSIPEIQSFKGDGKLIVCGSTWPEDERLLVDSIKKDSGTKWVIAPHEVEEKNIQRLEKLFPNSCRFSQFKEGNCDVLLIDSIGLLSKLYRYADVAYIGGAFRTGLHNILEATAYGVPTVFGPSYSRFQDAGEMVEKGLGFSVSNQQELDAIITELLSNNQSKLRVDIVKFMNSRTGATTTILEYTNKC